VLLQQRLGLLQSRRVQHPVAAPLEGAAEGAREGVVVLDDQQQAVFDLVDLFKFFDTGDVRVLVVFTRWRGRLPSMAGSA
jgi:hypothetical protein